MLVWIIRVEQLLGLLTDTAGFNELRCLTNGEIFLVSSVVWLGAVVAMTHYCATQMPTYIWMMMVMTTL